MLQNIKTEIKDNILSVLLNRPQKRNAINDATLLELDQTFSAIPKEVKCIIIHGEGDHFCAGLDLSELTERDAWEGLHHSRMWHATMDKIQNSQVPVIAAIHGACVGGGLEIVSACHLRVSDKSTFYALPEGARGIFVGGGGSVRVPRLVGMATMIDMMLTGRVYQAERGYELGFSQYICEKGQALQQAQELAEKICKNTPMTNFSLTQILPRILDAGQDAGLMMEAMAAAIAQSAPHAKQRLKDFLEGREKKVGE
jgi:enoyl-CoA hydratase/carnithine racemase